MFRSILTLFFLSISVLAIAQKQIPEPTGFLVNDYARLMSRQEVEQLGSKLRSYVQESSTQIVIVTETSLEGEDPFDYSYRLARAWGIGGGENDNGILIYVAEQDREIRIQTGMGTEGFLTDAMAKRIIDNIIAPAFRQGRYYHGLNQATSAIIELGQGEYTGEGKQRQDAKGGIPAILVIAVLIFLIILFSRMGQDDDDDDGGYYRGGRYDRYPRRGRRGGGWIFMPGPWIGGGGGGGGGGDGWGGFGGGGFGGFGGGDFGGGGAGGSW